MTKPDKISQILNLVIIVLSVLFVVVLTYSLSWLGVITWTCIGINATMNYRVLSDLNKSNGGE
jgi:hypothetical protein